VPLASSYFARPGISAGLQPAGHLLPAVLGRCPRLG
jgi:hypothetical protein